MQFEVVPLLAVLGTALGQAAPILQLPYTFQDIISPADPTFTRVLSISSDGRIAGYSGDGVTHPSSGFITTAPFTPNSFTTVNYPGAVQTQLTGINPKGDMVGSWVDSSGSTHGFTVLGGVFASVNSPNAASTPPVTQLLGIGTFSFNAAGFYLDADGHSHAVLYQIVGTPGFIDRSQGVDSVLTGEWEEPAEFGASVGYFTTIDGQTFGTYVAGGAIKPTVIAYQVPGSTFTEFLGIDNEIAVGIYKDAAGVQHGLVFNADKRTFETLDNPLGIGTTTITGAVRNFSSGVPHPQLVGYYVNAAGNTIGFLATEATAAAVPEPASFVLAGLALAGLTLRSRQRVTTGDSSRRAGRA